MRSLAGDLCHHVAGGATAFAVTTDPIDRVPSPGAGGRVRIPEPPPSPALPRLPEPYPSFEWSRMRTL